ncbi:hypothetical protein IQ273_12300 [Nodosilinea sp. LEGE 07298]|uniref:hypothetical protein n=1 Tax=Nodosilinea sp. LEGE 07298 TaxID=2777970 RepID=UPI001881768F|nr:hypothetical protein [Nodosilinea sp. LEGE 07298]MBE9110193.1 hypothetical protein [Nodosilinea sp. LEGE 07298]
MNYEDATLLRLADQTARLDLFDELSLEQLVSAAYKTELLMVEGPYQPLFTEVRLGLVISNLGMVEGVWNPVGGVDRVEARFHTFGLGSRSPLRVDALWRGDIVVRTVPTTSRITQVEAKWTDSGTIDAEIVAALGSLPANPQTLEQERRTRFLARIRSALDQPLSFSDELLDKWLFSVGAASVSDLITRSQGTVQSGAVQVTFSPPDPSPPSPKALPITAALLIRNADFSVANLLMESKMLREQLEKQGLEQSPDPSLPLRHPLLVVWVVPATVFDDDDWPGGGTGMPPEALRNARRAIAGEWLAREGIGLVATPT